MATGFGAISERYVGGRNIERRICGWFSDRQVGSCGRIPDGYAYPSDKQERAIQKVLQQAELLSESWAA
jgi:hypothetical protein